MHEITQFTEKFPTSLMDSSEVSNRIGIDVDRVNELAEAGYIPHYIIDGRVRRFRISEVKEWCAKHAIDKIKGKPLHTAIRIHVNAPPPSEPPPSSIREIEDLQQLPMNEYPSGIYFLCKDKDVIYVGQSISPFSRVQQHGFDFDRVYLLPIPRSELNEVESAFIKALRPSGNGRTGSGKMVAPRSDEDPAEVTERFTVGKPVAVSST